jgi:hypothetical protein
VRKILLLSLVFIGLFIVVTRFAGVSSQTNFFQFLQPQDSERNLLIPDVVPTAPLQILIRNAGGKKELRFSTTFYNQGTGAMEFVGHTDREKGVTYASQYVYEKDGPGLYRDIGSFVYHAAHNHWHIDQYVFYELWSVNGEGKADKLLITTDKMSFCIWDEGSHDLSLDKAPQGRVYARTCNGRQQGMSVGWSDTYTASTEGQGVDISNVPDGTYIFRTTINPDKKILETNYDNDTVDITVEIRGNTLIRK